MQDSSRNSVQPDRALPAAIALVAVILLAEVLFGATRVPVGELRFDIRYLTSGFVLGLSGLVLFLAGRERSPSATWAFVGLAFPLWLAIQLLPMPTGVVGLVSPSTVEWVRELWPGPLTSCSGEVLVAANPPSWIPLSLDPIGTREFLIRALAVALAFFASGAVFREGNQATRRLLLAIAIFTGAEAAYGLGQWITQSGKALWFERTAYLDCATGTLINRNHYAMLLYLGMGCTLSLLVSRVRQYGKRPRFAEKEMAVWVTLAALSGLQLAGIVASKSRAGVAVGLIVFLAALPALMRGRKLTNIAGAAVLGLCALPVLFLAGPTVVERISRLPEEWSSPAGRGAVFRACLSTVREFPLAGTGGGSFEWVFGSYRPEGIVGRYNYAHNDYLQVLVETGVVGLGLVALVLVLVGYQFARFRIRGRSSQAVVFGPLGLAILGAVVHELFDFSLQIPANAFLLAILAGAIVPTSYGSQGSTGRQSFRILVVSACWIAAIPAMLHSLAYWPAIDGWVPWPDNDAYHHRVAGERFRADSESQNRAEAACFSMAEEAYAQELRPLSPYNAVAHAAYVANTILIGNLPSDRENDLRAELERSSGRARRLDPWNPAVRERLMVAGLAQGEIGQALEDARVAGRDSRIRARKILTVLTRSGLPLSYLAAEFSSADPMILLEMLSLAMEAEDMDLVRQLVPLNQEANRSSCEAGWRVADALRRGHGVAARSFLERCLEIPATRADSALHARLQYWLATDLVVSGEYGEARGVLEALGKTRPASLLVLRIDYEEKEWKRVVRQARRLIDDRELDLDEVDLIDVRLKLGEAYSRMDNLNQARAAYEQILRSSPEHEEAGVRLRRIRQGKNPFEDDIR